MTLHHIYGMIKGQSWKIERHRQGWRDREAAEGMLEGSNGLDNEVGAVVSSSL